MKEFAVQFCKPSSRIGLIAVCLLLFAIASPLDNATAQEATSNGPAASAKARADTLTERTQYRITLDLDVTGRAYTGMETVRWVNSSDHSTNVLYFHLYPNLRPAAQRAPQSASPTASSVETSADEPRLEITGVRAARTGAPIPFVIDDQAKTLRVLLRDSVAAAGITEITIEFKGSVPEIDADETGLLAHLIQQVGAVLRGERELRRARDINFSSRGVLLLGASYPLLAARDGDDWQRKVEQSIGDPVYADVADYTVEIRAPENVSLFTSGEELSKQEGAVEGRRARVFTGENLRSFAIIAGGNLRSEERNVDGIKVRSVFNEGHEAIGRRVLDVAAESVRAFTARFGVLPFKSVTVAEAPLVAGLGSAEFSSFSVIASAFYVDFDAPSMRNLPEIVREQRASLEDSLEFAVAHVVAHQWWGMAVGNDPERSPVLDEALANWSALLYYKEVHGDVRAEAALDDQLRGVYKIYRTFGGEDMEADRASREYKNSFQYSAIVSSKGALMFTALRRLMGDERFFAALRSYYNTNKFEVAELDDLRGSFIAEAPLNQRRGVARTFARWLSQKRGDQDIAPPDPKLAVELGLPPSQSKNEGGGNAFARLGKFFWQQMTRLR